jgi:hypothetical protein
MFMPPCRLVKGELVVTTSVNELRPGTAQFYCYRDRAGHEIRFARLDGTLSAAFEACPPMLPLSQRLHYSRRFADFQVVQKSV